MGISRCESRLTSPEFILLRGIKMQIKKQVQSEHQISKKDYSSRMAGLGG